VDEYGSFEREVLAGMEREENEEEGSALFWTHRGTPRMEADSPVEMEDHDSNYGEEENIWTAISNAKASRRRRRRSSTDLGTVSSTELPLKKRHEVRSSRFLENTDDEDTGDEEGEDEDAGDEDEEDVMRGSG